MSKLTELLKSFKKKPKGSEPNTSTGAEPTEPVESEGLKSARPWVPDSVKPADTESVKSKGSEPAEPEDINSMTPMAAKPGKFAGLSKLFSSKPKDIKSIQPDIVDPAQPAGIEPAEPEDINSMTPMAAKPGKFAGLSKLFSSKPKDIKSIQPDIVDPAQPAGIEPVKVASVELVKPTALEPIKPASAEPIKPAGIEPGKPEIAKPVKTEEPKPAKPERAKPVKLSERLKKLKNINPAKLIPKVVKGGVDLYGIDMGSKSIKIVRLSRKLGLWTLEQWAHLPFPAEATGGSLIEKTPEAIDLLKNFLTQQKKKVRSAATSLSGNAVVIRYVKLPKTTPEELAESLPKQAESYIPFPIPEVNLAFEILGDAKDDGSKSEVVIIAAKKELESQQLGILKSAGLMPAVVDIDAFCLQRVVPPASDVDPHAENVVLVLNIGANITTMSLIENGTCRVARDVLIAGNTIDKALQKGLNMAGPAAEKAKQNVVLSDNPETEAAKSVVATLKGLVLEVQRSLDFYVSQKTEHKVQKVLLAGGCAQIQGLCGFLSGELRLPVEILDPFAGIKGADQIPVEIRPHMAIATGLAMRRESLA